MSLCQLVAPGGVAGARLVALRPLTEDAWFLDQALSRDPEVVRWTTIPADLTEGQARARVRRRLEAVSQGAAAFWVIEHEGAAVGNLGAVRAGDHVEIFYALVSSARGMGVMAAAIATFVASLERLGETATLVTYLDNLASQRTARRAGFEITGTQVRMIKGSDQEVMTWARPSGTHVR